MKGPAVAFFNVVNRADVGVIQSGSGLGFASKAFQRLVVFRKFLGQELERDKPMELGVLGLIDHAHAAATELLHDPILQDGLADHLGSYFVPWELFASTPQTSSARR